MAKLSINQARVLEDVSRNEPVYAERVDSRTLNSLAKRNLVKLDVVDNAAVTAARMPKDVYDSLTALQRETYDAVKSGPTTGSRVKGFRPAVVTSLVKRGYLIRQSAVNVSLTSEGQAMLATANRMVLEEATAASNA